MSAARNYVEPYLEQEDQTGKVVPQRKVKRKRRRFPATLKICLLAACCVFIAILYLQQQMTGYYLNLNIAELEEQVNLIEQRNEYLKLKLESERSIQKIETIARTELGMIQPESSTILVLNRPERQLAGEQSRWLEDQNDHDTDGGVLATLAAWLNKAVPLGGVEAGTLQR